MSGPSSTDVLEALLGQPPTDGFGLCATVGATTGHRCSPGRLLPRLIALEDEGLIAVDRSGDPFLYCLTPKGTRAAYAAGAAHPEPALLVMADLVGFTRFTEAHGDGAAHEQASRFTSLARSAARKAGGSLVKSLGDGVLLSLPPDADPVRVLRGLVDALSRSQPPWELHAAAHVGSPIRHAGDVFGRDVNLVARLCDRAGAGEVLLTEAGSDERVPVDGVDQAVGVRRVRL